MKTGERFYLSLESSFLNEGIKVNQEKLSVALTPVGPCVKCALPSHRGMKYITECQGNVTGLSMLLSVGDW